MPKDELQRPIGVALVEDDPRYRSSLALLLSDAEGFEPRDTFADPTELLEVVTADPSRADGWDMVVMDLDMPRMGGVEGTRRLKAALPRVSVVVLTVFESPPTIVEAICAGADGYLLKRARPDELVDSLRMLAAGGSPLTPSVARVVVDALRQGGVEEGQETAHIQLTERQSDVLRGLADGLSYKEIAARLDVSIDTVRFHLRALYKRLQVHSVAAAVSKAIRQGLIGP